MNDQVVDPARADRQASPADATERRISTRTRVSLVLPCRDEEEIVDATMTRILGAIADIPCRFEIVCVDDGSGDSTLHRLGCWQRKMDGVEMIIVELSRSFGKEAAIMAGLDAAGGDACILLDADLQDPPELIRELIEQWQQGYEAVALRRAERSSDTLFKRWTASLFYKLHNLVADYPIAGNVGDCRIIDRKIVTALQQLPENRRFMKGLFTWVGFRTAYIDIKRPARGAGASKFTTLRLVNLALEGLTSFSTSLLRLWIVFGMIVSIYAFLYGVLVMVRVLIKGIELPGYASLMVVVLFLGGIQMVGLGIIGEYVGRVYYEAKRRPIYVVRHVHRRLPG